MAHDRRVSFFPQQYPARWNPDGDGGHGGLLVVRPPSVFNRLGPKVGMGGDPPYVPESVGEPPLPGMIFGCTNETFAECMDRELFGLPIANKPQVMRIAPGASLFLFNFRTKCLHGIFEATSHGGVHIVRDAFGGKFAAQVKFRLAEECPSLDEMQFKEAILANYVDARKFKFFLNGAQVCRLKTLFREKAVQAWAVSEGIVGRRSAQLRLSEQQHARNTIQVQRRVINSASNDELEGSRTVLISGPPVLSRVHAPASHIRSCSPQGLEVSIRGRVSDDEGEGSRTVLITAPPILSRIQASPTRIRSHSPKGLEVSISSKDKKRNGAPDSPRRHVVMYEARKEQSFTPVLRSKIIRSVKEGVQSRSGRGIPQDRKRCADRSPDGRWPMQEQGPEIGENRPGKPCTDLRELLTRPNLKRLKSSTNESAERLLSKPMAPPVDSGGKIAKSDVLSDGFLEKDLEQGLPPPSKKHSTISLGPQSALISKDLVTPERAGSVQESRKNSKTIGPVNGVQENLKSADDRIQSLTASGSHCVNPKPMVAGTKGREVIEACRGENVFNNVDFKTPDDDGVGSYVQMSTSSSVKSGVLRNLGDVITESDLGDQSKDGGLDIYVSLTVEEAKIARQTDSRILSENQSGMEGVVRCILGKRSRVSSQHEPTLDSSMAAQAPTAERSVQQQKEGPKDSHAENSLPNVSLSLANASETLQERKNATRVASAEKQHLTSQAQARNENFKMENLSEGKKRLDHVDLIPTNVVSLNDAIPVVGTVITGNMGDTQPRDCKRHRAEKESGPSSPVHKLSKVGQNDAGCSYVTPEVSTPTNGGDIREKIPQKYGVDYNMPLQTLPNSLLSLKSGGPWNSRTLRYGRPRSADAALANHGNVSSKSGCEPTSASGKSELNVVSVKIGEESVCSGGQDYERQPGSSNGTVTSRTIGSLRTQHPLLVCELGNPGGLPLDGKTIKVDTLDESLRKDQPSRVASVAQESILPAETDSTTRLERFQSLNTAPMPTSDDLKTIEFGNKKIATVDGLTEDESQAADKICPTDDLPSKKIMQPTLIACNGGGEHPSLLSCMPHRANALQGARAPIEDDIQHGLDSTSRGFPSACISTASLSDCSGASGETKLEINIPIEEEELEICFPIEEEELEICLPIEEEELEICLPIEEEEEEVDAVPEDQIRRLWGSSNRDITPWKLLQKNSSQDA